MPSAFTLALTQGQIDVVLTPQGFSTPVRKIELSPEAKDSLGKAEIAGATEVVKTKPKDAMVPFQHPGTTDDNDDDEPNGFLVLMSDFGDKLKEVGGDIKDGIVDWWNSRTSSLHCVLL